MLELGRAGTHGAAERVRPVVSGGAVVATLTGSRWRERASAVVAGTPWEYEAAAAHLHGRRPGDPTDAPRLRARERGWWGRRWTLDLEGTPLDMELVSRVRGTHRYLFEGLPLATGGSRGVVGRATLTADDSVPLHQQVFLLWIEAVLRGRRLWAIGSLA